jgi:hypothetical protein
VHFNRSEIIAEHVGPHHPRTAVGQRMSHDSETADLEAQIAALIQKAGDSLRQQDADQPRNNPGTSPARPQAAPPRQSTLAASRRGSST